MDYWRDGFWSGLGYWIYDLQGLIGGLLALVAAVGTMWWLHGHRRDDIRRRNFADRAAMVVALSEICGYARQSIEHVYGLYEVWARTPNARPFQPAVPCPDYPQEAFDKLQSVIENANQRDAKIIAEFIALSQVQNVRLTKLLDNLNRTTGRGARNIILETSFYGHIFDALGIHKFADRMFEYARMQSKEISAVCLPEEASNSLSFMLARVANNDLFELVERRWPPKMPNMIDL
jgi:hypothetical protein